MSLITSVAQQHVVRVGLAAAQAAGSVEDAGRPGDAGVQREQVQHDLREAAALHEGHLPARQRLQLEGLVARFAVLALLVVEACGRNLLLMNLMFCYVTVSDIVRVRFILLT